MKTLRIDKNELRKKLESIDSFIKENSYTCVCVKEIEEIYYVVFEKVNNRWRLKPTVESIYGDLYSNFREFHLKTEEENFSDLFSSVCFSCFADVIYRACSTNTTNSGKNLLSVLLNPSLFLRMGIDPSSPWYLDQSEREDVDLITDLVIIALESFKEMLERDLYEFKQQSDGDNFHEKIAYSFNFFKTHTSEILDLFLKIRKSHLLEDKHYHLRSKVSFCQHYGLCLKSLMEFVYSQTQNNQHN